MYLVISGHQSLIFTETLCGELETLASNSMLEQLIVSFCVL